jgi:5-methylcytosine-specific restriction enzyme A
MVERISEVDLVLPALMCIERGEPEISTTELQACLRSMLEPTGEDLEILAGRSDDKFSQKVRNLRSHETLERAGWVIYERRGNNGFWQLTDEGRAALERHRELITGVLAGRFPYATQQETFRRAAQSGEAGGRKKSRVIVFDEDESVSEGQVTEVAVQRRERSRRLRDIALEHFRAPDGRIVCAACEFDFRQTYGQRGEDYIEIHHQKPIFTYEDEDIEQGIREALQNLVPLCSNCHRMVHRRRNDVWTLQELKHALGRA